MGISTQGLAAQQSPNRELVEFLLPPASILTSFAPYLHLPSGSHKEGKECCAPIGHQEGQGTGSTPNRHSCALQPVPRRPALELRLALDGTGGASVGQTLAPAEEALGWGPPRTCPSVPVRLHGWQWRCPGFNRVSRSGSRAYNGVCKHGKPTIKKGNKNKEKLKAGRALAPQTSPRAQHPGWGRGHQHHTQGLPLAWGWTSAGTKPREMGFTDGRALPAHGRRQ